MSLENADYVNELNSGNPSGLDAKAEGDDHIRMIKRVIKNSFPKMSKAFGAIQIKNANYTLVDSDNYTVIESSQALTLALPAIASLGTPFRFGVISEGGAVTITTTSPNTLNGSASTIIPENRYVEIIASSTNFYFVNGVEAGIIVAWSGSISSIPDGWKLCDGTNGTADLRDKFIVGAGNRFSVSATGGSADAVIVSHSHTASVSDPGHVHNQQNNAPDVDTGTLATGQQSSGSQYGGSTVLSSASTASATTGVSVTIASSGESGSGKNLPPYYALAFIQKV